ncbi:hypothetical protein B1R32_1373 [Abditibacterium utsteinense]|uniref:Restriction endonuclease n=1 Tax=Abditibacterium utsteinense TaxID=1960156 RepID=A0A2S8SNQ4_9BACT|nr:restriction endonuclease [Abditibacterium utsteinense]PQV62420.1 hypothetical protein B1R32_1373 [Abditibacterium utsteinense]
MKPNLSIETLKQEAKAFAALLSSQPIPELYGINDGKKVGTYVEIRLNDYLTDKFTYQHGSAANGVDIPELLVDVKATSKKQPQSSSPFRDSSQKVYGLGHHLLVFVYVKKDDSVTQTASLKIEEVIFIHKEQTADSQTTKGLLGILKRDGSSEDIVAFLEERNLFLPEFGMEALAERILKNPPEQGFLTISNALQWRLQFGHAIKHAKLQDAPGVENLLA